ncbi:M50 family metallopeptidase [Dyella humicola]|uniref:M50 family metallopeptidase n=1 Tax=Dyella humicola TaxID=2992126 RepID=UPI002254FFFC|nr:M50 family metallopeptidase [Dyella humicola]
MKAWMNRFALCAQVVLSVVTGALATSLCFVWLGDSSTNNAAACLTAGVLFMLALVVHELGHGVCARLLGMTVWAVNIAGLEFHAQRRGWKVRWSRGGRRQLAGFVLAFPQFGQPMRKQIIGMCLGGPVGNMAFAILFGAVGWLWRQPMGSLSLAFSVMNAGFALINLVPHQGAIASDGLRLLTWLRGVDEAGPNLAYTRVMSRSLAGQTANQLPEDELASLEQQPTPMPLVALWYRLKADQNRGDWPSAVSRSAQFNALTAALDPARRMMLTELVATLRTELAFSEVMLTGDGTGLVDDLLPANAAWTSPWLLPRCQALCASLRGDQERCARLLEVSRRKAENAIDQALWQSETLLRGYVAATSGNS